MTPEACTCGKVRYLTKRKAKAAAREQRDRGRMHAYSCGPFWHVGHLPRDVIRGRVGREVMPSHPVTERGPNQ